jgi:hypothetical protein
MVLPGVSPPEGPDSAYGPFTSTHSTYFTPSQHVNPDRVRVLESPQIPETLISYTAPDFAGLDPVTHPSAGFAGGAGVRTGDPRI